MNRFFSLLTAALALAAVVGVHSCTSSKSYADYASSSGFALDSSDAGDPLIIENLDVLCRVWGYVKYHHPVFSGRRFNIDYELFELLPQVARADKETRNRALCDWIDALGAYDTAPEHYGALPENRLDIYQTDLSWTHDADRLGQALSERLVNLRYADRRPGNRYVTKTVYKEYNFESENAGFSGEASYPEMTDPDCGYRLMAAFRFWNMVEYFFPSKHLTDKPWDDVLPEYIGRMIALSDGFYSRTMWRMIAEIRDSHASCEPATIFGNRRVPLTTAYVEGKVIVAAPDTVSGRSAPESGFRVGDEIVAVNGLPVEYFKEQVRSYISCSNEARVCRYAADAMLRSPHYTSLRVSYRRDGEERDTLLSTSGFWGRLDWKYGPYADLGGDMVYMDPGSFSSADEKPLAELLEHAAGLVVDLRHYPGSSDFTRFVGKYLLTNDSVFGSHCQAYTYPLRSLPGTFAASVAPESAWTRPQSSRLPIAVLVDNWTQSAGETNVQWFQTCKDVVVVGNRTAGANGNVSYIELPGGIRTCFSGLGWYYSDGERVQRSGVRIDVEVHPTVEGLKAGRDEVLEKALEILCKEDLEAKGELCD